MFVKKQILLPDFKKHTVDGFEVVPAIFQDIFTKEVLTLAYLDEKAWRQMLSTRLATVFSTSKGRIRVKGEQSGNFQRVVFVRSDCDNDALLVGVEPIGEQLACHTGARTCFYLCTDGTVDLLVQPGPKGTQERKSEFVEVDIHPEIRII